MNDNLSMNSSRPLNQFNEFFPQVSIEEKAKQLSEQNKLLQIENTKYHTKIIKLQNQIQEVNESKYKGQNNTSSNFYLPSELKMIWENIAQENIGDCFIDYFDYPIITYHLVQEMFYIISEMIKNKLMNLVHSFLSKANLNKNDKDYQKNYDSFFSMIKPFLQENFNNIFENNDNFNQIFLRNYIKFYEKEIKQIIGSYDELDGLDEGLEIIIKSKSFEKTIENIKKIILCIELNDQVLQFPIDNFNDREFKFANHLKEKDILNVNGRTKENQVKLILINPPQMKNGFTYQSLMPIILPCEQNEELSFYINKETLTCPGIRPRTISSHNLDNYTSNNGDEYPFKEDNDYCESNDERLETDINHQKKIQSYRYLTNRSNTINAMFSKYKSIHGYTRSFPKNTVDQEQNNNSINKKGNGLLSHEITFAERIIKTNKNQKIYKIKRQGKDICLQEIRDNGPVPKKWLVKTKENKLEGWNNSIIHPNICSEERKQLYDNSTSCSITDISGNKKKYIRDFRVNSKGSTSELYIKSNTTILNNKMKDKKHNSIDQHGYELKTNAVTKLNVDELLSFKNKGKSKMKEFRSTFTETTLKDHFD